MFCDEPGCDKQAEFHAVWPWGAEVKACSGHRNTFNQKATQQLDIPSGLPWVTLNPGKVPDLTRDERTNLRAQILAGNDEVADRDRRIADLVRSNGELSSECSRLRNINAQREQELKEAKEDLATALEQRDRAQADAGAAIVDRDRLRLTLENAASASAWKPPAPSPVEVTPPQGVRRQQQQASAVGAQGGEPPK